MSNRKADALNKYIGTLSHLGYTKDDPKIQLAIHEIEKELGLVVISNGTSEVVKNPDKVLVIAVKDSSGSMGIWENSVVKEYYNLALVKINSIYSDVEEKFISHSTVAKYTSKDDFFKHSVSGGTIVSSGLKELLPKFETEREVIVIQFSDGDNLTSDCPRVLKLLKDDILPKVKYFKYVEANQYNRHSTLINSAYKDIKDDNFEYMIIKNRDEALKGLRFGEELDSLN